MWDGSPAREDTRKMRVPHLTLLDRVRIFEPHGDVAELADAQVSEACDGDIVEVQVLSSPPKIEGEPLSSPFLLALFACRKLERGHPVRHGAHHAQSHHFYNEGSRSAGPNLRA